jgi:diguanylate cyclase (GGDEF)-like protein
VRTVDRSASGRPFDRDGLGWRLLPFAAASIAGIIAPLASPSVNLSPTTPSMVGAIAIATAAIASVWILSHDSSLPEWCDLLPIIGFIGSLTFFRGSVTGSSLSYLPLMALAIWWLALYHSRSQFVLGCILITISVALGLAINPTPAWEWIDGLQRTGQAIAIGGVLIYLLSKIRQQQTQLADLVITDQLTGTANMRSWDSTMRSEISWSKRHQERFSIGALRLDQLNEINERHGYPAGDAFLSSCTDAWIAELRDNDTLFRLHGASFVVLLPRTESAMAAVILDRIRRATPTDCCNIGGATWDGSESVPELLQRAYSALDNARSRGDSVVIAGDAGSEPAIFKATLA